jgi:hypothetical protein
MKGKASSSFVNKRTKKLYFVCRPRPQARTAAEGGRQNKSLFASFSSEKEESLVYSLL